MTEMDCFRKGKFMEQKFPKILTLQNISRSFRNFDAASKNRGYVLCDHSILGQKFVHFRFYVSVSNNYNLLISYFTP